MANNPKIDSVYITGTKGGQSAPPDSKNWPKTGKRGEKEGKNWEKEEESERKGKTRKGSFTFPLLADRADYATVIIALIAYENWKRSHTFNTLRWTHRIYAFIYVCLPGKLFTECEQ